jgi:hypothetical protein
LSSDAISELSFMFDIIFSCNGQYIFSHTTLSHVVNLGEVWKKVEQIVTTAEDIENLYVSDASDTHAFVYKADGSFDYVRDFEFSSAESQSGSGHRELLAIKMALTLDSEKFKKCSATKVYWQTDSRNCFNFLLRGSRKPKIQLITMTLGGDFFLFVRTTYLLSEDIKILQEHFNIKSATISWKTLLGQYEEKTYLQKPQYSIAFPSCRYVQYVGTYYRKNCRQIHEYIGRYGEL